MINTFNRLDGKTIQNLLIGDLIETQPTPRYSVACSSCNSRWSMVHNDLVRLDRFFCRNSACRLERERAEEARKRVLPQLDSAISYGNLSASALKHWGK